MALHTEPDHIHLVADPSLYVPGPEGQRKTLFLIV